VECGQLDGAVLVMMPSFTANCRHSTGSVESNVLPLGSVT
jgi:hypothetical protein